MMSGREATAATPSMKCGKVLRNAHICLKRIKVMLLRTRARRIRIIMSLVDGPKTGSADMLVGVSDFEGAPWGGTRASLVDAAVNESLDPCHTIYVG
jgi:hypothetical protein